MGERYVDKVLARDSISMCSPLGTSVVDAQTKGIVVDGVKGRSLSDVNIYLQKDSVGIGSTDRNGEFMFSRDQITISDTIVFSHVGYFPLKCTLSELQHLGYKVVLHEHPNCCMR